MLPRRISNGPSRSVLSGKTISVPEDGRTPVRPLSPVQESTFRLPEKTWPRTQFSATFHPGHASPSTPAPLLSAPDALSPTMPFFLGLCVPADLPDLTPPGISWRRFGEMPTALAHQDASGPEPFTSPATGLQVLLSSEEGKRLEDLKVPIESRRFKPAPGGNPAEAIPPRAFSSLSHLLGSPEKDQEPLLVRKQHLDPLIPAIDGFAVPGPRDLKPRSTDRRGVPRFLPAQGGYTRFALPDRTFSRRWNPAAPGFSSHGPGSIPVLRGPLFPAHFPFRAAAKGMARNPAGTLAEESPCFTLTAPRLPVNLALPALGALPGPTTLNHHRPAFSPLPGPRSTPHPLSFRCDPGTVPGFSPGALQPLQVLRWGFQAFLNTLPLPGLSSAFRVFSSRNFPVAPGKASRTKARSVPPGFGGTVLKKFSFAPTPPPPGSLCLCEPAGSWHLARNAGAKALLNRVPPLPRRKVTFRGIGQKDWPDRMKPLAPIPEPIVSVRTSGVDLPQFANFLDRVQVFFRSWNLSLQTIYRPAPPGRVTTGREHPGQVFPRKILSSRLVPLRQYHFSFPADIPYLKPPFPRVRRLTLDRPAMAVTPEPRPPAAVTQTWVQSARSKPSFRPRPTPIHSLPQALHQPESTIPERLSARALQFVPQPAPHPTHLVTDAGVSIPPWERSTACAQTLPCVIPLAQPEALFDRWSPFLLHVPAFCPVPRRFFPQVKPWFRLQEIVRIERRRSPYSLKSPRKWFFPYSSPFSLMKYPVSWQQERTMADTADSREMILRGETRALALFNPLGQGNPFGHDLPAPITKPFIPVRPLGDHFADLRETSIHQRIRELFCLPEALFLFPPPAPLLRPHPRGFAFAGLDFSTFRMSLPLTWNTPYQGMELVRLRARRVVRYWLLEAQPPGPPPIAMPSFWRGEIILPPGKSRQGPSHTTARWRALRFPWKPAFSDVTLTSQSYLESDDSSPDRQTFLEASFFPADAPLPFGPKRLPSIGSGRASLRRGEAAPPTFSHADYQRRRDCPEERAARAVCPPALPMRKSLLRLRPRQTPGPVKIGTILPLRGVTVASASRRDPTRTYRSLPPASRKISWLQRIARPVDRLFSSTEHWVILTPNWSVKQRVPQATTGIWQPALSQRIGVANPPGTDQYSPAPRSGTTGVLKVTGPGRSDFRLSGPATGPGRKASRLPFKPMKREGKPEVFRIATLLPMRPSHLALPDFLLTGRKKAFHLFAGETWKPGPSSAASELRPTHGEIDLGNTVPEPAPLFPCSEPDLSPRAHLRPPYLSDWLEFGPETRNRRPLKPVITPLQNAE